MNKNESDEKHETWSNVISLRNALPRGLNQKTPPQRPDWDTYFQNIAKAVSARADCRRAQHGAVIVKDRRVVATGYNAAPAGGPSCLAGECPRGLLSNAECKSLSSYENCISLHAEQNALAYSSWRDTRGGTLYCTGTQCDMCRKLTIASGIVRVVWPTGEEVFEDGISPQPPNYGS